MIKIQTIIQNDLRTVVGSFEGVMWCVSITDLMRLQRPLNGF